MTGKPHTRAPHPAQSQLNSILDPEHPLTRSDVIWMLEFIKKKVADEDPALMDLSQPRLLQNFRFFAEASMALIQRRNYYDQEADRLREWLKQAAYGLLDDRQA